MALMNNALSKLSAPPEVASATVGVVRSARRLESGSNRAPFQAYTSTSSFSMPRKKGRARHTIVCGGSVMFG